MILCSAFTSNAQDQHLIDSLTTKLKFLQKEKMEQRNNLVSFKDTTEIFVLVKLSAAYAGENAKKAMDCANQSLTLSKQIDFKKGIAMSYHAIGVVYWHTADFNKALENYRKALPVNEQIDYKKGVAWDLGDIALAYESLSNYPKALEYFLKALTINEKLDNKDGMAWNLRRIGFIYLQLSDYSKALENEKKALSILKQPGQNGRSNSSTYSIMGNIYFKQGNYPEAVKSHLAALKIYEEIGHKSGIAYSFMNIGNVYSAQGNYSEALKNHFAALKLQNEIGDKDGMATCSNNIGEVYTRLKKYNDASEYLKKGLLLSKEIGSLDNIKDSYNALAKLDSAQGNYIKAFEDYKLFVNYRDSLVNTENTRKTIALQMNFDFDKKQTADSLKYAREKEVGALLLQRQKAITYVGFGVVVLTMIFLIFVYRSYRQQRLANRQLKEAMEKLIKSEKMAAFGMMASRVSHEIQNPLNFVDNFSELSQEMVADVINSQNEVERKQHAEILIKNLQKINIHGKRASAIVKQLQEHTLKGTAQEFFEEE